MNKPELPKRIVLTGGPCAGKTSVLNHIVEQCAKKDIKVFCVPEVASILIGGGADLGALDMKGLLEFERNLISTQLLLEDTYFDLAKRWPGPAVVICDRGTMDVSAYLPPHVWQVLLDGNGWTDVALRDQRYDAVIHLVSAAVSAPEFYTTANNAARSETPEQAAALDRAVQTAWIGHPHLRVVNTTQSFDDKIQQTLSLVESLIGLEGHLEIEKKYLIEEGFDAALLPVPHKTFQIEQTYLESPDGIVERVRKRAGSGASVYTHTIKMDIEPGVRKETESIISGDEYINLLQRADDNVHVVKKERRCFLWQDQYFELDSLVSPHKGLQLLELELDSQDQAFDLPDFLPVAQDVTENKRYTNYGLAQKA